MKTDLRYDKRLQGRFMREGQLTPSDLRAFLESLEDCRSGSQVIAVGANDQQGSRRRPNSEATEQ